MKNFIKLLILCFLVGSILGCSQDLDVDAAKTEIDNFHKLINAEEYAQAYDNFQTGFKEKNQKQDALNFLSKIRGKLGKYENTRLIAQDTHKSFLGPSYLILKYDVVCEHGRGTETFFVSNENNNMKISAYNMRSNDFLK